MRSIVRYPQGFVQPDREAFKKYTFDGTTGTTGVKALFTVTGMVLVRLVGRCTVDLVSAGGGTIKAGTSEIDDAFFSTITGTTIDVDETVLASTGNTKTLQLLSSDGPSDLFFRGTVLNNISISMTIATATITAGVIEFCCIWRPVFPGSVVVPA